MVDVSFRPARGGAWKFDYSVALDDVELIVEVVTGVRVDLETLRAVLVGRERAMRAGSSSESDS